MPTELAGRWANTLILQFSGDVETVTTTWTFDAAGSCIKQVRTFSVVEGFALTTFRPCRFQTGNSRINITFTDTGGTVSFMVGFAGFSPDRLLLDDLEFQRLP